jgi:hypothetical protein
MPSVANFPRTLQTGALERKPSTHACVVAFRVATARDVTYRQVMPGALAAAIVWQQTVDIPVPAAAISLAARAIGATGGRALPSSCRSLASFLSTIPVVPQRQLQSFSSSSAVRSPLAVL